jgi:hypothetical protein
MSKRSAYNNLCKQDVVPQREPTRDPFALPAEIIARWHRGLTLRDSTPPTSWGTR